MSFRSICRVVAVGIALTLAAAGARARAEELPQDHEYQRTLRTYLATLTEQDFTVDLKPVQPAAGLSEDDLFRCWLYTDPPQGGLRSRSLRIAPSAFMLAAIEGPSVMTLPVNALDVAVLAAWEHPSNPYFNSRAIRNRALVLSVIDMVMFDQLHEQQPGNAASRSDYLGGTLIWLAFVGNLCRGDLPADVRSAYETGLRKAIARIEQWGPRGAMTDMDLFASVSLWYAKQMLGDAKMDAFAQSYARRLYTDARHFHPAGYFVDDHCFDASYNGISLFFASWASHASDWPFVKEALNKAYRLRGYLCLPEPNHGGYYGPSHFNSRCSSDSYTDQWNWSFRNTGAAMITDFALPFAQMPTSEELQAAPAMLAKQLNSDLQVNIDFPPQVWRSTVVRHWTRLNFAAFYAQPGFYARLKKLHEEQSPLLELPWDRPEPFIENFADTLLVAKFPTFGVVIHTGEVTDDDWRWHRPVGFGGGALSAFWTPASGPTLLGRRRGIQGKTFDSYEDWRLWPTHAITGITAQGKVISSARVEHPQANYDVQAKSAVVRVTGAMPTTSGQGQAMVPAADPVGQGPAGAGGDDTILQGTVSYSREFRVDESGLDVVSTLRSDGKDAFAELYEVIPVFLGDRYESRPAAAPTTEIWLQIAGEFRQATVEPQDQVQAIQIRRQEKGAVLIKLARPARVRLSPEVWVDGYMTSATCRNIMIDLLNGAGPSRGQLDLDLRYHVEASVRP